MLGREYNQHCSIARTLELLGERWTLIDGRGYCERCGERLHARDATVAVPRAAAA